MIFENLHPPNIFEIPEKSKRGSNDGEINVLSFINEKTETESFYQMSFEPDIPQHIKNERDTPKAVKYLKKASVALMVCVAGGQPIKNEESKFHVYFPTDEYTGTGFIVHGDFYVKPDRTRLMPGAYNFSVWHN